MYILGSLFLIDKVSITLAFLIWTIDCLEGGEKRNSCLNNEPRVNLTQMRLFATVRLESGSFFSGWAREWFRMLGLGKSTQIQPKSPTREKLLKNPQSRKLSIYICLSIHLSNLSIYLIYLWFAYNPQYSYVWFIASEQLFYFWFVLLNFSKNDPGCIL